MELIPLALNTSHLAGAPSALIIATRVEWNVCTREFLLVGDGVGGVNENPVVTLEILI